MVEDIEKHIMLHVAYEKIQNLEQALKKAKHDNARYKARIHHLQRKESKKMYVVIVSQYYDSFHSYIAEYDPNSFYKRARGLIEELETYKREEKKEFYYGDFDEKKFIPNFPRYNVTDDSDIYFFITATVNDALKTVLSYPDCTTGKHIDKICKHHQEEKINSIVCRYFILI